MNRTGIGEISHGTKVLVAAVMILLLWFFVSDAGNFAQSQIPKPKRFAVVIGNSQYQNVPVLKNAVNDAERVTESLKNLGFEVFLLKDSTTAEVEKNLAIIQKRAEGAEATLFYYSGHGFQMGGQNYLVPVNAVMRDRSQIEAETLRLDAVISALESGDRQTLIFLDACRNNPLPASLRKEVSGSGLAQLKAGKGTYVAFATKPGFVTADGVGENSPFTEAFIKHVNEPGISINDLMILVRNSVQEATFNRQTPWEQSSLTAQFYFNPSLEDDVSLSAEEIETLRKLNPALVKKLMASTGITSLENSGDSDEPAQIEQPEVKVASLSADESRPRMKFLPANTDSTVRSAPPIVGNTEEVQASVEKEEPIVPRMVIEPRQDSATLTTIESTLAPAKADGGSKNEHSELQPNVAPLPEQDFKDKEDPILENKSVVEPKSPQIEEKTAEAPPSKIDIPKTVTSAALEKTELPRTAIQPELVKPISESSVQSNGSRLSPVPKTQKEYELALANTPNTSDPIKSRIDGQDSNPNIEEHAVEPEEDYPDNLALAVQQELKRLGCYRSALDGDWGNISRKSLLRYHLRKKTAPDNVEPSIEIYNHLRSEQGVICKYSIAPKKKKKPTKNIKRRSKKKTRQARLPKKKTTTKRKATSTKPSKPARKAKPANKIASKPSKRRIKKGRLRGVFR